MEGKADAEGQRAADAIPLARRPDFPLGAAVVRPSVRTVEGPGGSAAVEPRVMQVLIALVDAGGAVLTRDDLLRICWNGTLVGEDSVNRAIAQVRRVAGATQAGFGVETIPRIGYRLTDAAPTGPVTAQAERTSSASPTRRWVAGGGLAVAAGGGLGAWVWTRQRTDARVTQLVDQGRQALRYGTPQRSAQAAGLFREAAEMAPRDPAVLGWLALALRNVAEYAPPQTAPAVVAESEQTAKHALARDPREPNALSALVLLGRDLDDVSTTETKLRDILALAPDNVAAISALVLLLQSVGLCRESWVWNERAITLEPLSPSHQFRRALKHWIFGRVREADQVIDRARQLWSDHAMVWHARLLILAFSDRPRAALAMVDDDATRPPRFAPGALDVWRTSLRALETRAPRDIEQARVANLSAAPRNPGAAADAIMVLSALEEVDAAFAVAEGFLLQRGPLVSAPGTGGPLLANDRGWRKTQWLYTPATAPFRADPRYPALCEGIGLTDYWRTRNVTPDTLRA